MVFSAWRDLAAFPILQIGAVLVDGWSLPKWADVPTVFILGALGMFGNQFFFILSLTAIAPDIASVLNLAQPIFSSCIATTVGQEPFRWLKIAGLLFAVGGAAVMLHPWAPVSAAGNGSHAHSSSSSTGYVYNAVGSLCMASYFVFQKPVLQRYPPLSLTAWCYCAGAMIMLAGSGVWYAVDPDGMEWSLRGEALIALLFAVLANSVLKYGLQSYCNKHVPVTVLTAWGTLVPVFTELFSWLAGTNSKLSLYDLGTLPIFAGLALVTLAKASPAPHPRSDGAQSSEPERIGYNKLPGVSVGQDWR
jgi:drug/metabolite transporter (DMT)-like permease